MKPELQTTTRAAARTDPTRRCRGGTDTEEARPCCRRSPRGRPTPTRCARLAAPDDRGGRAAGGGRRPVRRPRGARRRRGPDRGDGGHDEEDPLRPVRLKDALVALYLLRRAHRWREYLLDRLTGPTPWVAATATVANEWCSWSSARCRPGWHLSDGAAPSSTPTPSSATASTQPRPSSARRRRGCAPCSTPSPATPTWEPTST